MAVEGPPALTAGVATGAAIPCCFSAGAVVPAVETLE
jgi:hypothetical protein